jgi:hypothetical protein
MFFYCMNEQTASTPSTAAARRKKTSRILFEFTGKEFSIQSKENPQGLHKAAAAWLQVLKDAGKALDRDECLTKLAKLDTGTSQQPIRIIYYWKKTLVDGGWIRLTKKESAKPKAEAAPAPVPAPVAATAPTPPPA